MNFNEIQFFEVTDALLKFQKLIDIIVFINLNKLIQLFCIYDIISDKIRENFTFGISLLQKHFYLKILSKT